MEKITSPGKFTRFVMSWLILFVVWLMFTSTLAVQEVITGLITAFLIALFTSRFFTCCDFSIFSPVKLFYIFIYFFVFLWALITANLDVARRVISPKLPINPGIVKFKTKLTSDFAKMVLANSITLTPGTLSVDIIDDTYYIHWIDVKSLDPEEVHKDIAEQFEKILLKIF
ncbi:MAG: Na+/H+ antiporter subunit E [Bacteroidales bacterium]|nr:Na+/H+ antiporter subunit E [Bacteroidales bacterium]